MSISSLVAENFLTDNARKILEDRYLRKDTNGNIIETPDEMFWRVANYIAKGSEKYGEDTETLTEIFYSIMADGTFLPNSPTLVNAGTDKGCLSACFVRSPEDNMKSIMQVAYDAAMIEKWGGGIGFGVSNLRPKSDAISTTHGKALGAIETLKIYSYVASKITQGSFRLGAHMGQLICSHPEIEEFINCKDNFEELKNFNISVQITDEFMNAVKNGDSWNLVNPKDGSVVKTVLARDIWSQICESAWKTGDPGVVFMDRVWETAPNPHMGKIQTSNPCGEEHLEDGNNCCLGSINLSKFVDNGKWVRKELEKTIRIAVLFLDNVIEVNEFPLQYLKEVNMATRRIGLGVMGWADALIKLNIPYDSDLALKEAEEIGEFIKHIAWDESANLAEKRGAFPEYENSALKEAGFPPIRNSSVITIAPTGTISRLANCSSGIEPHFKLAWYSNILWKDYDGTSEEMVDCPAIVRQALEKIYFSELGLLNPVLEELIEDPTKLSKFSDGELSNEVFRTALDISPESHVKMQAVWQKNTTNAVSKTINMPQFATVEDIKDVYLLAWDLGCKGVTIYREKTRDVEVLSTTKSQNSSIVIKNDQTFKERPQVMSGVTPRYNTGHGSLFVTLNSNGKPAEVFSTLGKAGGCHSAYLESISRLISLALQSGISSEDIVKQLDGITCCPVWSQGQQIKSPADAIAKAMQEYFSNDLIISEGPHRSPEESFIPVLSGEMCQRCNGTMINQGGCPTCESCSWSKCS